MRLFIYSILLLTTSAINAQSTLKSVRFARLQMLTDVPKENVIGCVKFVDSADDKADVVRLDFVIPNSKPLVVSSKQTTQADSLGAHLITISNKNLGALLDRIHRCNSKASSRAVDYILLRVTYRSKGDIFQYYISNEKIVIAYLRSIFDEELRKEPEEVLAIFYEFLRPAQLKDLQK
jgi:hypothetical protein